MNATQAGNILLVLATIPAVLSVVVFSWVKWYQSPWGRHVMFYMSSVALVLCLGCLRLAIQDLPVFAYIRTGTYLLVVTAFWWRLVILWISYREGPPEMDGVKPAE